MTSLSATGRVIAVLGPTNTGKTHLALERMLGHRSGMIGFPLRLLARENYDRIVRAKGRNAVALLTGEEKIVPAHPQWFVCTVESMPLDRRVDFLAVDEIQLAADPDRGHVFTDRLLRARGDAETMFLGAETIKPLIRRLVPAAEFVTRPRFSRLSYSGGQKLQRLPPRSAIVAFSAADVYTLAELMRRQKGGAAVVLGALSPRTRNAQVGLYQAGEVDYLVATDAIGMGLNMDVDHVAFAGLRKFDGRVPRALEAPEVAQIAGRAGRHMNDGTFGTSAEIGPIAPDIVDAVENHAFPPLKRLQWRNSELRFTSIEALLASLNRLPAEAGLIRARDADDQLVLQALAADAEVAGKARSPQMVRLLWDVCQIPDFRKTLAEQHSRLLGVIFRHLSGPEGRLPADWLDQQIRRLDRTDGEIDTLIGRIASIRTWTYVSHRGDWLDDAAHWRDRSRAIEDRLSDALHERLTQRFVDRRTAVLVRRMKDAGPLSSDVDQDGAVLVEGQFVGKLKGFRFEVDRADGQHAARTVAAAASRALRPEIAARVAQLAAESDQAFSLDAQGSLLWQSEPVARLVAGAAAHRPMAALLPSDLIEAAARDRLSRRLAAWLDAYLAQALGPLSAALTAPLSGPARGLAYQLSEGLGSVPRRLAEAQIRALSPDDRKALAALDIRLGTESVFLPRLLKPGAQALRALLWCVQRGIAPIAPPSPGAVTVPTDPALPTGFLEAVGYRPLGPRAVRLDMLERFAAEARHLARQGPFPAQGALAARLNLPPAETGAILEALGYRAESGGTDAPVYRAPGRRSPRHRPRSAADRRETSPFAALRAMPRA